MRKSIYGKHKANVIFNGKTAFPLKPGTKRACPLSLFLFNIVLLLASVIRQEKKKKEIKRIQIGNKEIKLSMFSEDMIIYVEILKS